MEEAVEIKFEREDLEGIVPIGTYLADAAGRMGIELYREPFEEGDFSIVKITKGGELLSAPTQSEITYLSDEKRGNGDRLAEQTKIERAGEIAIMTTEKPAEKEVEPTYETRREDYRREFEELPLQRKISSLVELEAIALSDTLSFVANSPYLVVGKLVDLLAEFGFKIEDQAKKQARPAEHRTEDPPPPSVTEEDKTEDPLPSVTEEAETENPLPSVTEESKTENPLPSVTEEKPADSTEPPPPSV